MYLLVFRNINKKRKSNEGLKTMFGRARSRRNQQKTNFVNT